MQRAATPELQGPARRCPPSTATARPWIEVSDEVKIALEDPARGRRVQSEPAVPDHDIEAQECKLVEPALTRPVVVGELHAVAAVAHPVHEAQHRSGDSSLQQVILDKDRLPADARRLTQQLPRFAGVVEHVDEHHDIEALAVEGKDASVELADRDGRTFSDPRIDPG